MRFHVGCTVRTHRKAIDRRITQCAPLQVANEDDMQEDGDTKSKAAANGGENDGERCAPARCTQLFGVCM